MAQISVMPDVIDYKMHQRIKLVDRYIRPFSVRKEALGNCELLSDKSGVKSGVKFDHWQRVSYEGKDIGIVYIYVTMITCITVLIN